ncbi:tRNA (adenosine(37)-N6)-threonylcarbamoyltransferase complex ATPase subunit type 1 TsaE [Flavobacterium sp.]|uniref:tRNA (adenosine(37)-N6)-threonylcarbamoyltransferase complex ATPase subunit type 1 TsaE n=1 Tax=Flavobacterium sp. TaxID=239 RepID=UPI002608FCD2|nr:tRNA (adenosine(37)-N6)-threonylcarbamoyltransferase complex ATPase subunit type 1 TsaE [Flavobacterium sp.]MDD3005244.1 tRNA (adenosine(37)-N6)-threonylcarbamoyltransferase complex ATPase subunit type 1 TsaE [Flavobacterium sp.]
MEIEFSIEQIDEVAQRVILQPIYKVILFNGMMGVGKTTFIKALCKALGVEDATSSPTFSLVNEYETSKGETIYHFDVYRLKNEEEAYDMGMDEYLYSGAWNFIEWPEKIPSLIPEQYTSINLTLLPNGNRKLILE